MQTISDSHFSNYIIRMQHMCGQKVQAIGKEAK